MDDDIEVGWILRAIARRWWMLAVALAVGAALGMAITAAGSPQYEASATLALSGPPSPAGSSNASSIRTLITSPAALDEAAKKADPKGTPTAPAADAVFVDPVPNTAFLRLRVRQPDAARAGRLAEALAERAATLSRELQHPVPGASEINHRLTEELDRATARLQAAEQRLLDYRRSSQLEVLRSDVEAILEQRKMASALPLDIESERARLAAAREALRRLQPDAADPEAKAGDTSEPGGPVLLASAFAREIAESLARLAALEQSRRTLRGVAGSGGFKQLQELHRRELDLARLQRDHDMAAARYAELAGQMERGGPPLAVPVVRVVESTVPAGTLVQEERLRKIALSMSVALLTAFAIIVLIETTTRSTRDSLPQPL